MINNLSEAAEKLNYLKVKYEEVVKLSDSLSEFRDKYREFTTSIDFDYFILEKAIQTYEHSLLIECYTFSEQLVKSFIYHILGRDNNPNKVINKFIKSRLPDDRFSPRMKFDEIYDDLNKTYLERFSFILFNDQAKIKIYNQMVKDRHLYAHKGDYVFILENYRDVIDVIEYLTEIFLLIVEIGVDEWSNFIFKIEEYFIIMKNICNHVIKSNKDNPKFNEEINQIHLLTEEFINYKEVEILRRCKIINNFFDDINQLTDKENLNQEMIKAIFKKWHAK